MRTLLVAAALVLAACEKLSPPGECADHLDCRGGQECSGGVCIRLETDHQVGSRCIRDMDCAAWANCNTETCVLSPGMCTSGADCTAWEECSPQHWCVPVPGRCGDEADCEAWEDCAANTCVLSPGTCGTIADCPGWQICDGAHVCVLAPNGCENDGGCASWQDCVSYRCATAPGFCAVEADCASWQDCGTDHLCALTPGMCGGPFDCATWQQCSGNFCTTAPGFCADATGCAAWQGCPTDTHVCTLLAGRCGTSADCATWQYCGTDHVCADVGATCGAPSDCEAWQDCASGHCVNQVGRCGTTPECDPTWQQCDAGHTCVAAPGRCATSAECLAWQTCVAHSCQQAPACVAPGDCAAGETCQGGFCTADVALGEDDIVLFGNLKDQEPFVNVGWDAIAPLKSPSRVSVGFWSAVMSVPETSYAGLSRVYLDSAGDLVYVDYGPPFTLRRFVRDAFEWNGVRWNRPSDPLANDPVIPTPACSNGPSPSDWVMQQGTDAVLYQCYPSTPDLTYYDTDGFPKITGYRIHAWRSDGLMLGESGTDLFVIDAAGNTTRLTAPILLNQFVVAGAVRAHLDGFRFVIHEVALGINSLWFVDATGVAVREGAYPYDGPGLSLFEFQLIDSTGAAYRRAWYLPPSGGVSDAFVRCPLLPGACTVVYDERDAPPTDLTVTPPHVWVRMHDGAALAAKP